jgi:hypothetical protein
MRHVQFRSSGELRYNLPAASAQLHACTGTQLIGATRRFFLLTLLAGAFAGLWTSPSWAEATSLPVVGPTHGSGAVVAGVTAAPAPKDSDGDFLLKTIAALSVLGNVFMLISKLKGGSERRELTNDPLRVEGVKASASHDELTKYQEKNDAEHDKINTLLLEELQKVYERIEATRETILRAGAARETTLSQQMAKLTERVGELRGQVAEMSKRMK